MSVLRTALAVCLLYLLGATSTAPLQAQVTRADSAAVLLQVARQLDIQGKTGLARDVLAVLLDYFDGTQAALEASTWLTDLRAPKERGSGRTGLTVWNTVFGAWLGVAVPAAFGADEPGPYGAGLLIGAPLGFFGTRAITAQRRITSGQAIVTSFGSIWGTFQSMGWRAVLDIGTEEQCFYDPYYQEQYCYEDTPDEAPWAAAVVGGLAGLAGGAIAGRATDLSAGTATAVQFGGMWGTWYGVVLGVMAGAEDDALLTWSLLGGNAGLLGTALTTPGWEITAGQAWLITAGGIAGGVAGLGVTLLLEVDDAETGVGITAAGTTMGLASGLVVALRGNGRGLDGGRYGDAGALINLNGNDWTLGLPIPQPALFKQVDAQRGRTTTLGVRVPLLAGKF